MKVDKQIKKLRTRLIDRVRRKGLYGNFGQKEVRQLKDEFNYSDFMYGTHEERIQAQDIDDFDEWCSKYTGGLK